MERIVEKILRTRVNHFEKYGQEPTTLYVGEESWLMLMETAAFAQSRNPLRDAGVPTREMFMGMEIFIVRRDLHHLRVAA